VGRIPSHQPKKRSQNSPSRFPSRSFIDSSVYKGFALFGCILQLF
jgi:hypothetical protein